MDNFTCIIVDDEPRAIDLLTDHLAILHKNIEIIGAYTQWGEALEALRTNKFDILFLDISIQGKNGMGLLKCVPNLESEVIFITAYTDYALDAFKIPATGYIVKPIDETELAVTVDKAIERVKNKIAAGKHNSSARELKDKIGIPHKNAIDYIDVDSIIYLEAAQNYTKVITTGKIITSAFNIGKYKTILNNKIFYQVHRSYLINLNHISKYETEGFIVMDNNAVLPVAKNFREDFLKNFNRVKYDG